MPQSHCRPTLDALIVQHQDRVPTDVAARCLDVTRRTVRNMYYRGELRGAKIGRSLRIDSDSLAAAIRHGTEDLS